MTKKKKSMLIYASLIVFAAAFYCYVAYNVPYTGDDWDWGLDIGLQHLLTADINSRYAGNFFAVIMTHSKSLQTLIMGASYLGIPLLMTAIVTKGQGKRKYSAIVFVAANCLLLTMDSQIWQQTYGWVSGFANYGISAVLLLVYLYVVQPLFADADMPEKNSAVFGLLCFLLGLVMQLFIENLAAATIVFSTVIFGISCLRRRKVEGKYIALLTGNTVGLIIMFSNAIYPVLFNTGKALINGRRLSYDQNGGIWEMVKGCAEVFTKETATLIWEKNVVICCSISILLIILWIVKSKKKMGTMGSILIVIDILSIPYFIIFSHLEYGKYFLLRYGLLDLFEVLVNVGFCAVVAVQIVMLYGDRKWHMGKLLFLWLGAPVVILPLTAVVIEGSRFYITSNSMMVVFALFLLVDCLAGIPENTEKLMLALGLSALLSCSLFYFFIYREISICTCERMQIMEQAKQTGAKDITLPAYSYMVMDYVWWGEPGEEYREVYFREFFGLDPGVNMTFRQE